MLSKQKILITLASLTRRILSPKPPSRFTRFKSFSDLQLSEITNNALVLRNENVTLETRLFKQGIFHIMIAKQSYQHDPLFHTPLVINPETLDTVFFTISSTNKMHYLTSLTEQKFSIGISNKGKITVNRENTKILSLRPYVSKHWFKIMIDLLSEHLVFGLGENTGPMNKQGQTLVMWNTDNPQYELGSTPLYQSWPVSIYLSRNGQATGIVIDYPGYSRFTFSSTGQFTEYLAKDATHLHVYVLTGPSLSSVMTQLYTLLGTPLILPKWAFGYQQSRWSYSPKETVLKLAKTFREKNIPCDVLYLDIDYMDKYKCFTWSTHFEPHQSFLEELHAMGYKVVSILDPGIKIEPGYELYDEGIKHDYFMKTRKNRVFTTSVWAGPSHFPDFLQPKTRQWWAEHVKRFAQTGIDGIWCDMNEPSTFDPRGTFPPSLLHRIHDDQVILHERLHNVYGMFMAKATFEGLKHLSPQPFVITRSAYLGSQQFSITWTGDNKSSWDHFQNTIPMLLNLSLSGQPISGPDIGGFRGHATSDLFKRWIQESVCYPFMRNHTAYGTRDQEPWAFDEVTEHVSTQAINLRYQLIPYLYSEYLHSLHMKQPLLRPLFYETVNPMTLDPVFFETQVYWGPNLLFAPYHTDTGKRTVYLPPGTWIAWWSKQQYLGDSTYVLTEKADPIPIFVKANTITPYYHNPPQYIRDQEHHELSLLIPLLLQTFIITYTYHENIGYTYSILVNRSHNQIYFEIARNTGLHASKQLTGFSELRVLFILESVVQNIKLIHESSIQSTYQLNTSQILLTLQPSRDSVFSLPLRFDLQITFDLQQETSV